MNTIGYKNRILFDQDKTVAEWVMSRLNYITDFGEHYKAYGITRNKKLIAGIVFHDYNAPYQLIQFTVASSTFFWAERQTIEFFLNFVFEKANVYRLSTYAYIGNWKAIRMLRKVGFRQEAILDSLYGRSHHGASFRLLRPEYAWRVYKDKYRFKDRDYIIPPPIPNPDIVDENVYECFSNGK